MTERGRLAEDLARELAGIRALIVEDDYAVADALRMLLESSGCEVTGMAGDTATALDLLESIALDIAVLDIRLASSAVTPVAIRLLKEDIPFFYVSGYSDLEMLPEGLGSVRLVEKPADPALLLATIVELAGGPRDPTRL